MTLHRRAYRGRTFHAQEISYGQVLADGKVSGSLFARSWFRREIFYENQNPQ